MSIKRESKEEQPPINALGDLARTCESNTDRFPNGGLAERVRLRIVIGYGKGGTGALGIARDVFSVAYTTGPVPLRCRIVPCGFAIASDFCVGFRILIRLIVVCDVDKRC